MAQHRPLYEIADEIWLAWPKPYFGAVPYLQAMTQLSLITDTYIAESAESVVRYFLNNAKGWRGDVAREIKAELRGMLK